MRTRPRAAGRARPRAAAPRARHEAVARRRCGGPAVIFTCEHAGKRVPREYVALFRGAGRELAAHRGWDPGALAVARSLSRRLDRPLLAVSWSRLLVEANRSPTNPRVWSRWTRDLPAAERARILDRYWEPHRRAVMEAVRSGIADAGRVVHLAVHSFTPSLDGRKRTADVGLLYDPGRPGERRLCARWKAILGAIDPALRVRRNYPYLGVADGLTTWLRRRFAADAYLGVELEVSQARLAGPGGRRLTATLAASLERLLGDRSR